MRKLPVLIILLSALLTSCQPPSSAAASQYKAETVFNTQGVVWSFAFLSPEEMLVTLREGKLLYVNLAQNTHEQLPLTLDLAVTGQGGLLDVHVQRWGGVDYVYLTYSTRHKGQLTTVLARGIWDGGGITELGNLFIARVRGNSGRHFGSRLAFKDDHIYMTVGDRGDRDYAQDLSYHNGKILRLTMDGKPAVDNPFIGTPNALPEIWSYGHRNPQGIGIDATGTLYSVEFGPRGGDELNRIESGKNYGWPLITYGREYWGPKIGSTHHPDMEQPVTHWTPSISPSGMAFYRGDKIPQWQGDLFVAALGSTHLRRLALKNNDVIEQEVLLADIKKRIRHVRNAPDGNLYISTDSGEIIKITP